MDFEVGKAIHKQEHAHTKKKGIQKGIDPMIFTPIYRLSPPF